MNKKQRQAKAEKFFADNDRFADRHKHKTKEQKEKEFILRELMWKAIDEKDENFSIVETSIALGLTTREECERIRKRCSPREAE